MENLLAPNYSESLQNLQTALSFIEAYFRYLPYDRASNLEFNLTFYGSETDVFSAPELLTKHLQDVFLYQIQSNIDIDIIADLNVRQTFKIDNTKINLFYYGQPMFYYFSATVLWNCHWDTPSFELRLEKTPSSSDLLELLNNVHTAITGQINLTLNGN